MNSTLRQRLTDLFALTTLVTTLAAVAMPNQAYATDGLLQRDAVSDHSKLEAAFTIDFCGLPSQQGMAPGHIPVTGYLSALILPPLLRPDTTDSRWKRHPAAYPAFSQLPLRPLLRIRSQTSAGKISSQLAYRETLVGAKPSGTS